MYEFVQKPSKRNEKKKENISILLSSFETEMLESRARKSDYLRVSKMKENAVNPAPSGAVTKKMFITVSQESITNILHPTPI